MSPTKKIAPKTLLLSVLGLLVVIAVYRIAWAVPSPILGG